MVGGPLLTFSLDPILMPLNVGWGEASRRSKGGAGPARCSFRHYLFCELLWAAGVVCGAGELSIKPARCGPWPVTLTG